MTKILVVDDDPHIREVVSFSLKNADFTICEAANGRQALDTFCSEKPDLIVLDIMMPELDGIEVCREIRKTSLIPIIFLTAKSDEIDMIIGLELGGDDYIAKPFSPRQLVTRVRTVLRRCQQVQLATTDKNKSTEIKHGALTLDAESFKAYWLDKEIVLTVTEFNLLHVLAEKPEKVFSREDLMQKAYDNVVVSDRTIDSHIRRVRAKIATAGGEIIKTVHGLGYKLGIS